MKWQLSEFTESTDPPIFGNAQGAHGYISVHLFEGEKEWSWHCRCEACFEIDNSGLDSFGKLDDLNVGVHYIKAWHSKFMVPGGGFEYSGGLALNTRDTKDEQK